MAAVALAFVAGTLSVVSPCVLPLLPITVAAALQQHRHGPIALAAGLVVTSTATGLFFTSLGFATGIDRDVARDVARAGAAALMRWRAWCFAGVVVTNRFRCSCSSAR